ncbi:MAG: nucleotidyl transferase AbiEii/AbiGii toxin family protein [Verrucomicrobiota bacterium]|nr:nucleotidyl transferase AbiEii/AbiGii toxin family protein [Verrucomicrobiota bacterium]
MNRVAALPEKDRNELFTLTAEKRGMGTIGIVEKDFWVCWTLKHLFEHPILSGQLVFKGGTSLSKVYGLIDRFSEDIDLVLDWRVAGGGQDPMRERSTKKQQKFNKALNEWACVYIAQTMLPLLNDALGSHCSLEVKPDEKDQGHIIRVEYPKTSHAEGLLPYIQLEIGPLASWLPHSEHTITPYAAEDFPEQFDEPRCSVRAINAERTFWEKATILHHEAHRPEESVVPERYSRHYYDLCLMASDENLKRTALGDLALLADVVLFKKKILPSQLG